MEGDAQGTFTNTPGSTEDINTRKPTTTPTPSNLKSNPLTALTPFHSSSSSSNSLYTSATARSTLHFGYTYPELIDWNVTASQLSSNIRTILNKLYNPSGSIATRSLSHSPLKNSSGSYPSYRNATEPSHQYFINIRINK